MNRPKITTQLLQNNSPLNYTTESKSRICSPSEHQLTDSGFESLEYSKGRKVKAKSLSSVAASQRSFSDAKTIPFDISFVGGIFSFKLYHFEVRLNLIRFESIFNSNSPSAQRRTHSKYRYRHRTCEQATSALLGYTFSAERSHLTKCARENHPIIAL